MKYQVRRRSPRSVFDPISDCPLTSDWDVAVIFLRTYRKQDPGTEFRLYAHATKADGSLVLGSNGRTKWVWVETGENENGAGSTG